MAGFEILEIYCVPARRDWALGLAAAGGRSLSIRVELRPEADMAEVAGYAFHRGALAFARRPPELTVYECLVRAASRRASGGEPAGPPDREGRRVALVLPETIHPENLGASFRNAAAFGCEALFLGPRCPDPWSRRVLRVSMGASLVLPWSRLAGPGGLDALVASGYSPVACVLDPGAEELRGWEGPEAVALMLGNEAFGLSGEWLGKALRRVTLPMRGGADSLNVAAAAAVFLYALMEPKVKKTTH
jgi:tRNA G18 (ribose-2'-O)-methylase SpoU